VPHAANRSPLVLTSAGWREPVTPEVAGSSPVAPALPARTGRVLELLSRSAVPRNPDVGRHAAPQADRQGTEVRILPPPSVVLFTTKVLLSGVFDVRSLEARTALTQTVSSSNDGRRIPPPLKQARRIDLRRPTTRLPRSDIDDATDAQCALPLHEHGERWGSVAALVHKVRRAPILRIGQRRWLSRPRTR
jgi:hypothetical protein